MDWIKENAKAAMPFVFAGVISTALGFVAKIGFDKWQASRGA